MSISVRLWPMAVFLGACTEKLCSHERIYSRGREMAGKPKCVRKEAGIVAVKWERNPKIEPDKE